MSFMPYMVINIYYSVMCYNNHINSTRIQSIASMALMVFPDVPAFPTTKPAPSCRCQTNAFAMLYKRVVMLELWVHFMTCVTRYLLVSWVERETNNDLKSSLVGSDRPSGLYNSMGGLSRPQWSTVTMLLSPWCPSHRDILCFLGVMFALKSVKRFPSKQKSPESVKWP